MKSTHTPERLRLLITSAVGTVLVATVAVVPSFRFEDSTSLADAYEASRPVQAEDGHWHEHDPARKNDLSQSDEMQADGTEGVQRSEEHTPEFQSLMCRPYAVFRLKKKKTTHIINRTIVLK